MGIKMLSQLSRNEDIGNICGAVSPGSHCPLFGVIMSAALVGDLAVLVCGGTECCANVKNQQYIQGLGFVLHTFTLEDIDIIFGVREKLAEALRQMHRSVGCRAVMLVSSCIPEMTGEDLRLAIDDAALPIPVMYAHTSHYNSSGYYKGITSFFEALSPLLRVPPVPNGKIALLGARYQGYLSSEIPGALRENGFDVFVPHSVESVSQLSGCRMTLVVDVTGLPLAEHLNGQFGIPYVRIDHLCQPSRILCAYSQIDAVLGTSLSTESMPEYRAILSRMEKLRKLWAGKTFIVGAPFFMPFELTAFFSQLEMKPAWIFARELFSGDRELIDELLSRGIDAPVSSFASYDDFLLLKNDVARDLFFGPTRAKQTASLEINPNPMATLTGFSLPAAILHKMESFNEGKDNGIS